ncbi:MAG: radical SAM protein [Thermoplasmata archaeon]|nr:MAG: radical SAM protein [Thermoplasmata archaeon]
MNWRNILSRYARILDGEEEAGYLTAKSIETKFSKSDNIQTLWKIHDKSLKEPRIVDSPEKSLLDLKIEIADRIFRKCEFCERRCRVDRTEQRGACGVKEASIASEFLHIGEEYMLIPSYTIFFSGCTFHCVFCQNWDISQNICGIYIEPQRLAEMIKARRAQGALNVNWVGGDPTPNLPYILKVLRLCDENIPQIWNSNMYCSLETMKLLDGIIDLYLTDFKYGNNGCAERLSLVRNYMEIVERNHCIAYSQTDMLIRHLVMPNHIRCCTEPVLKWISKNTPQALVNIMAQYRPEYKACEYDDISRPLKMSEHRDALEIARELGLNFIY